MCEVCACRLIKKGYLLTRLSCSFCQVLYVSCYSGPIHCLNTVFGPCMTEDECTTIMYIYIYILGVSFRFKHVLAIILITPTSIHLAGSYVSMMHSVHLLPGRLFKPCLCATSYLTMFWLRFSSV